MYLKIADVYSDNAQLATHALLRSARLYEDKEDFKNALDVYGKIAKYKTEESKFAQERIDWINGK